jgi:hypothetical protein
LSHSGHFDLTAKATLPSTLIQGISAWLWNTTPRSRLGPLDFAAVHEGVAGAGFFQPGQHVEDGGLAAAGVADDADELALVDVEVDVVEHRQVGVCRWWTG